MSNLLDLVDQTVFAGERATGTTNLLQCVWVYDRSVDIDGLLRFQQHLRRGRLSRLVERSALPFGRHRWVSPDRWADIEIVGQARARGGLETWLDEQAHTPLDSEYGPGWHLAVLPFTDGGTAVSLVISHCLTDGVGLCAALAEAARGRDEAIDWPAARSLRRRNALREDARQTVRDIPAVGRAVVAAVRMARQVRSPGESVSTPSGPAGPDRRADLASATVFIPAEEWDARAKSLGGTSNALLAGVAARLAQRVGRVGADGTVSMSMPVNERLDGDTRANAVSNVDFTADPAEAARGLGEIRSAIKQALVRHQDVPDQRWALLPLLPLLPKRLLRRMVGVAADASTVTSSNLGAIDPDANRPDGTEADYFVMKSLYPGITESTMRRTGGVLALLSGRLQGNVFIGALAYEPGNANDSLRQNLSGALADFSLTYQGWRCTSPAN
jgi:hypothetical protein